MEMFIQMVVNKMKKIKHLFIVYIILFSMISLFFILNSNLIKSQGTQQPGQAQPTPLVTQEPCKPGKDNERCINGQSGTEYAQRCVSNPGSNPNNPEGHWEIIPCPRANSNNPQTSNCATVPGANGVTRAICSGECGCSLGNNAICVSNDAVWCGDSCEPPDDPQKKKWVVRECVECYNGGCI